MPISRPEQPVFRFAPSPNGFLHLGHALSAIINHDIAADSGGRFLLRIEDIDRTRCRPEFEAAILDDLAWLELEWEEPVRRQSDHLDLYASALEHLKAMRLVYPSAMTRGEIRAAVAASEAKGSAWPRDPDGTPLYPGRERGFRPDDQAAILASGRPYAWRLDMEEAVKRAGGSLSWQEKGFRGSGEYSQIADPAAWGDVVLSRSDAPSSYHLSVVVDDAVQGVTHIVRGRDLYHATSVHRLLQRLLELPEPVYHHHRLILGPDGRKLSKSNRDTGIAAFRAAGHGPADIRAMVLGEQ
ncbi:tRNA glutamyl-Q(34) synthetase GluQRS [Sinorhizobium medicae]|uniref:tRNA glutamyl-Q(34) synthetase GluQRS n=3 Tax=Sinorhizobium medicae TaxID=110321 RepID=A0A6G1WS44_9HYPH|nr:tRNA glutamyl-Q(34) synthetase GluQRS [Sinorhizobium medicae]ABR61356.1 glutamyl-tRNA synthetase class Ic [Sinorhizobium medicae WSM419]MDX0405080.1 tRNA glutamyl-Q(34) synthetase GluQRS [Sinorhizobium medicae]MDX0410935.1 tRNA glutamyl-Q(34) synthetase GluQRS [Sinorhizobium medicae]MDX0417362.1 tRNA glutamyl-Q(34) synthetase GluQRS [Sinorhizobium medicae]MDX0435088.1 tRNA glutamyl-Q(34) synthetase GluQRS [Sinorhizobium medicae]